MIELIPVEPGQVWEARWIPHLRLVTGVSRAIVYTDRGQTTVFKLLRDYRLLGVMPDDE